MLSDVVQQPVSGIIDNAQESCTVSERLLENAVCVNKHLRRRTRTARSPRE